MLVKLHEKWVDSLYKGFLGMLEFDPNAKMIDLGCGKGAFTLMVANRIGTKHVYGLDIWDEGIKECESKGIKVTKGDLNQKLDLPSEESDVVISNQVIEHLFEVESHLREIHRILKPSGYAIISTENLAAWDNIFSLLLGYTPFSMHYGKYKVGNPLSPYNNTANEYYPAHVRIFTYRGLLDFLTLLGFKIVKIDTAGHVLSETLARIDKKHTRFITVKVRKNPSE